MVIITITMIINKKRIRNINPYVHRISDNTKIVIGVSKLQRFSSILTRIGFSEPHQSGQSILPPGIFGPVSLYNCEVKNIVHKDQPMETVYREVEWHWQ